MKTLFNRFCNEEAGFVVSAELILISTVTVLSLVVGLSEVSYGINGELEDVGAAFGSLNQSFCFSGFSTCGCKNNKVGGSCFVDHIDLCDKEHDICPTGPTGETGKGNEHGGHGDNGGNW
ncbi:MAG: branched-chain amino acid aminotransferase [Planctomycetia bacterium]|nr:branched-chain amino acid aminotransferase [Planctomycetia bacterium]